MAEHISRKGVKVRKGQSVMEALEAVVPHWEHEKIEDPSYVLGYRYARNCRCSVCGYESSFEKPECPRCRKKMKSLSGL
ncbi:MAG: hypothetical protein IKS37_09460 [Solobacterium sp.]|jgi:hypothetical protein|nr:hypothetical protein [Solobacterium sp.]